MTIQTFKNTLYTSKVQIIQIDKGGKILESEDNLFVASKNKFVAELHPFFEGIEPLFTDASEAIHFPCVSLEIGAKHIVADIDIIDKDGKIFISIFDFTDHYANSHPMVQERNEASILKNRLIFENDILLAKEDLKNKFLAHLNHEIRNPLNNVLGFLEILEDSKLSYEQKEILNVISKTGKHLKVLLDDLVDISKIEKGIAKIKNIPFSLSQVLTNLEKHFQLKYEKSNIGFGCSMDKAVEFRLMGDPTRLNQILFNLVDNAHKNTKEGSVSVEVRVKEEGTSEKPTQLLFKVSDTGKGISKNELDQVFDSYRQLEFDEIKPIGEGLGLKIVKELVTLLNGTVKVESVLEKGTTFEVMLPFMEREKKEPKKKVIPKGSGIVISKRILVLENEEIMQMLMMKTFLDNDSGYFIEIARDGMQTLQLLEKRKYDLVLLKMQLPDMDGYQVLSHIRNNAEVSISTVPILVVSGSSLRKEQEAIFDAGASEFLAKPYTKKELFSKINKVLKR